MIGGPGPSSSLPKDGTRSHPRATARHYHASASSVLRALLTGPARRFVPRAIYGGAIHLGDPADDGIEVAVVAPDAVVHPHAVVLASVGGAWPFGALRLDSEVTVGDRRMRWRDTEVEVTRWWSPTPAVGPTEQTRLQASAGAVRDEMATLAPVLAAQEAQRLQQLVEVVRAGDGPAAASTAVRLLGLGAGTTPTGDDLLAGLLAGVDRFGSVLLPQPDEQVLAAHRQVVAAVLERCDTATTALSARLLRHAAQGQVCRPAGGLIRTMARGGCGRTLAEALHGLLAVGSSSGRDLALGLLASVDVLRPVGVGTSRPVGVRASDDASASAHLDVRGVPVPAATSPNTHGSL